MLYLEDVLIERTRLSQSGFPVHSIKFMIILLKGTLTALFVILVFQKEKLLITIFRCVNRIEHILYLLNG